MSELYQLLEQAYELVSNVDGPSYVLGLASATGLFGIAAGVGRWRDHVVQREFRNKSAARKKALDDLVKERSPPDLSDYVGQWVIISPNMEVIGHGEHREAMTMAEKTGYDLGNCVMFGVDEPADVYIG